MVPESEMKDLIKYGEIYIDQQYRTKILCVGCQIKNSFKNFFLDMTEYWSHVETDHWKKVYNIKINHDDFLSKTDENIVDLTESGDEDEYEDSRENNLKKISEDIKLKPLEEIKAEETSRPASSEPQRDEVERELSILFGDNSEENDEIINTDVMNTQQLQLELSSPIITDGSKSAAYNLIPTPEASPVENSIPNFSLPSPHPPALGSNTKVRSSVPVTVVSPMENAIQQTEAGRVENRVVETSLQQNIVSVQSEKSTNSFNPPMKKIVPKPVEDTQRLNSNTIQETPRVQTKRTDQTNNTHKRKASKENQNSELNASPSPQPLANSAPTANKEITFSFDRSLQELLEAPCLLQDSRTSMTITNSNNKNNNNRTISNCRQLLQNLGLNMEVDLQSETNTSTSYMDVDLQSETNTSTSYMEIDSQSGTNSSISQTCRSSHMPQAWRQNSIYNRIQSYDTTNVQVSTIMPDNREQNLFSINTSHNQTGNTTTTHYTTSNKNDRINPTTANSLPGYNSSPIVHQQKTFSYEDYKKSKKSVSNQRDLQFVQSRDMQQSNIVSSNMNTTNIGNIHTNSGNMHTSSGNAHISLGNMNANNIISNRRQSTSVGQSHVENSNNHLPYQQSAQRNQSTFNNNYQRLTQSALNSHNGHQMMSMTNGNQHLQLIPTQANTFSDSFQSFRNHQLQQLFINEQLIHQRRNSCQPEEFKCRECRNSRKFKTMENLKKHHDNYHGNGKSTFYCEVCDKRISITVIDSHSTTIGHLEKVKSIGAKIHKRRKTIAH